MSLRGRFKNAVKTIYARADDVIIEVEFLVKSARKYDARNPIKTDKPSRHPVKVFDETTQNSHVDGNKVEQGDRVLLIDHDLIDFDLSLIDKVKVEGRLYRVVGIQTIVQDILFIVQIRGMS